VKPSVFDFCHHTSNRASSFDVEDRLSSVFLLEKGENNLIEGCGVGFMGLGRTNEFDDSVPEQSLRGENWHAILIKPKENEGEHNNQ